MEKTHFNKKIIIIERKKKWISDNLFSHSMAEPLALYLCNKFCFVSM